MRFRTDWEQDHNQIFFLTETSVTLYCNITILCLYIKASTQVGTAYGKYITCITRLMKANLKSLCEVGLWMLADVLC